MKRLKCFSLKYLVRYIVVVGVLSALAGAQQTVTLIAQACNASDSAGAKGLACGWANNPANPTCVIGSFYASPFATPQYCTVKSNHTAIEFYITTDGFVQTWQYETCADQIQVDNNCQNIVTPSTQVFLTGFDYPPDPSGGGGGGGAGGCGGDLDGRIIECPSPIIIDTRGEGFHLTSAAEGVHFDIRADGHPIQIAWTGGGYGNGFLALDRNHNGTIDSGTELFGNFTQQPKSPTPNGFLALAEFDKPENGGNGDGIIDEQDAVYSHLVIWIDENHDGISQPTELHTLPEMGIYSLSCQYKESRRTDEFGNLFRYRAKVNPSPNDRASDAGRWAVDVFLTTMAK